MYLSACSTQLKTNTQGLNEEQAKRWSFAGKIAIKVNTKSQKANITWETDGNDYDILLYGPFGQGKIHIQKLGEQVSLTSAGKTKYADNSETLLYQTTGLSLPISSLRYWIRGIKDPNYPANKELDLDGDLAQLKQEDWTVNYSGYDIFENNRGDRLLLPNKLKLANQKANQGEISSSEQLDSAAISATIVIKEWQP